MAPHTSDDKMLIHYFQDNLSRSGSLWYNQLDLNKIHSWKDLGKAFMVQYKYMLDLAPTRETLKAMEKKDSESFKEYAHRWRDLASQVQPPLEEKEISSYFLDTLKDAYFDRLFSLGTEPFSKIVVAGERLESGLKPGKISGVKESVDPNKKGRPNRKREGDVNEAHFALHQPRGSYEPYSHQHSYQPLTHYYLPQLNFYQPPYIQPSYPVYYAGQPTATPTYRPRPFTRRPVAPPTYQQTRPMAPINSRPPRERPQIDPIPYTYTELLPQLLQQGLLTRIPYMNPLSPPYSIRYDPNAYCDFHSGTQGHSTDQCMKIWLRAENLAFQRLTSRMLELIRYPIMV